ncbi:hypothetical protein TNCV_4701211 [Trichonephila clavipes]|nr:hypothetical protein TNCV_4701211 [Trichonephila clavipes]
MQEIALIFTLILSVKEVATARIRSFCKDEEDHLFLHDNKFENSSGILTLSRGPGLKSPDICSLHVHVPENHILVLSFENLYLPLRCRGLLLISSSVARIYLCQSFSTSDVLTSNTFVIHDTNVSIFMSETREDSWMSFTLVLTALSKKSCGNSTYQCANGYCANKNLACDSHNNCGDYSDEYEFGSTSPCSMALTPKEYKYGLLSLLVFLPVVGFTLLFVSVFFWDRSLFNLRK